MFNRFLFVFLPASLLVMPCVFQLAFEDSGFYFAKESGAVENITAVLLAAAIAVVVRFLIRLLTPSNLSGTILYKNLTILWSVIYCLGCVYFLGEEVSWGQHLFGGETPEAWQEINDQDETNLHNISGWLDQVPRTILSIGIVGGGFIFPLLRRRDSQNHAGDSFLNHFMPGWNCVYAGGCFVAIVLMLSLVKSTGVSLPQHTGGEVKESLIAMFLLVYIGDFSTRAIKSGVENLAEDRVDCGCIKLCRSTVDERQVGLATAVWIEILKSEGSAWQYAPLSELTQGGLTVNGSFLVLETLRCVLPMIKPKLTG